MAEMEVTHEGPEAPRSNMNQWIASQVIPTRCEVAIHKPLLTNEDKRNHLRNHIRRRSRLLEDQQKDQIYTDYTPPTHATNGTRVAENEDDKKTIAKLRADLKRYKRKNKALKERLQEVLNLTELEKTLRMTLHSFGVPLPETPNSRPEKSASPWQGGDWRQEVVTLISDDEEEEEEEENGERNDVQEFQEPLQSHGSCMYVYQAPESLPYLPSESEGEREMTGAFNHNTNSLLNGDEAKETLHRQSQQVELVPEHAGNGYMVDSDTLNSLALKKGATYTLLTRNMMPLVFSMEEMTTSCVRGERARGKGALTSPARQALDQIKVQAVIDFVRHKFPYVQSYQIIQTMNQKLVDVRSRIQKRRQRQKTTKRGGMKSPTK